MSIFPATDLVIDVGRAADPAKKADAVQRLERISVSSHGLDEIPKTEHSPLNFPKKLSSISLSARSSPTVAISAHPDKDDSAVAFKKFEAFLLQTWLEVLLPKENGGAYGHDNAGGVWRSLMAEQLGDQLAKSDCIGIGRLLARDSAETHASVIDDRIDFALRNDKT
jgi:flagellar protein FlgJ